MNDHLISRRAVLAGTAAAGALSLTGFPARAPKCNGRNTPAPSSR